MVAVARAALHTFNESVSPLPWFTRTHTPSSCQAFASHTPLSPRHARALHTREARLPIHAARSFTRLLHLTARSALFTHRRSTIFFFSVNENRRGNFRLLLLGFCSICSTTRPEDQEFPHVLTIFVRIVLETYSARKFKLSLFTLRG